MTTTFYECINLNLSENLNKWLKASLMQVLSHWIMVSLGDLKQYCVEIGVLWDLAPPAVSEWNTTDKNTNTNPNDYNYDNNLSDLM